MDPHEFEHDGTRYEVHFERVVEGWICRILREGGDTSHVMAFPDAIGFDPSDVRESLIAGCEAAVAVLDPTPPTRH